ncbi:MAG: ABC transporter permease [Clostridiaceae bacterium]|nr:ABC transporter permease [Clostridiaceae bacterium]
MIINPILQKDLKTKLRGWRSTILICCYVTLLAGILFLFFAGNGMLNPVSLQSFNPRMAINAYNILITFQFALLFIAVPAITAVSISSERERQTLDLMLVTATPARTIILGKIMVSIAHTMLLLVASLPVIGIVFFFGGIGIADIAKLLLFYLLTAFYVASCGVFFSTIFKRNITSIIITYIFLGLVTFGPFLGFIIYVLIKERMLGIGFNPVYRDFVKWLFPSPVFGYVSFYFGSYGGYGGYIVGIGDIQRQIEMLLAAETGIWKYMHPWIVNGLFSIISSIALIFFSTLALNPVKRKL